jgi:hypothetical protein
MTLFTRAEPAKNLHRFYVVRISPTLFGDWTAGVSNHHHAAGLVKLPCWSLICGRNCEA